MKKTKNLLITLLTVLMFFTNFGYKNVLAEEEPETRDSFNAYYDFIAGDGSELPDEVMAYLPETVTGLKSGDDVYPDSVPDVSVGSLTYHFEGWNSYYYQIKDDDVYFVGL